MISEILFGVVALGLVGLNIWEKYESKKERARFINAILSKTPEQFRDLELTDKVKPIKPPVQTEPNLIPTNEATDEEFEKMIKKEIS